MLRSPIRSHALADLYRDQGDYARAEPLYQRTLVIREQALAPAHPETASTLSECAVLRDAQGRRQEAASLCRRALVIRERAFERRNPLVAETRSATWLCCSIA
ncbi:MAG TPA: tetratricopeptide repeat protein [Ktedonobacteraceae bacterium]|jgi:tetratricopeptide (TPR) repeat protein